MFKVNNKDTRKTSMTSFRFFIVNFELISHLSPVDFEQVNVSWAQPVIRCSKLTTETLEQGVKYVQS